MLGEGGDDDCRIHSSRARGLEHLVVIGTFIYVRPEQDFPQAGKMSEVVEGLCT
jgi:hypothetical protein